MKTSKELVTALQDTSLTPQELEQLLRGALEIAQRESTSPETRSTLDTVDFTEAETVLASSEEARVRSLIASPTQPVVEWPELDTHRYTQKKLLGRGAMGEVWRMRDLLLNRDVALKLIQVDRHDNQLFVTRFIEEAKISALLTHPSIISIYDVVRWKDGRLGFLMEEVKGVELSKIIHRLHKESPPDHWAEVDGWTLKRLIDALLRVGEAIAFAHDRGVIHRDLKPNNIMVGEHGQVWVLDWGLARPWNQDADASLNTELEDLSADDLSAPHTNLAHFAQNWLEAKDTPAQWRREALTQMGEITGTPYYMPPEQAAGRLDEMGPWSDVYALGAILYEILSGRPPYANHSSFEAIKLALYSSPPSLRAEAQTLDHQRPLSGELIEICETALSHDRAQRIRDARDLSTQLRSWLDGSQRRAKALKEVEIAQRYRVHANERRAEASLKREEAELLLGKIPSWESANHKQAGWSIEDEAKRLEAEAEMFIADELRSLHSAINLEPTLREARTQLAKRALEQHRAAEHHKRFELAATYAMSLSDHLSALPPLDPVRLECERYLSGQSTLELQFTHEVTVEISRFERINRILTPLHCYTRSGKALKVELPIGSYLLKIFAKGVHTVVYPIFLERAMEWDTVPPDQTEAIPLALPQLGSLQTWERYVPPGWFYSGGDPETPNSTPERRVWVDGFSVSEAPITNRQFLQFLNHLVQRGRLEDALVWAPREQANEGELGQMRFVLNGEGSEAQFAHPIGDEHLEKPVVSVTWYAARAYADWLSSQIGGEWRLPLELEIEKAARGVDRRSFPWGDDFDPSFCVMMDSHPEGLVLHPVKSKPSDCSVYGVWDCAGNIREWCLDAFYAEGAPLDRGRARFPTPEELKSTHFKSSRGGSLGNSSIRSRCADRDWWFPHQTYLGRGFRVARSLKIE